MSPREWLNVLAILESIDEVPGLHAIQAQHFRADPIRFFRRGSDEAQTLIWAEVTRRLDGRAEQPALPGLPAIAGEASCSAS